MIVQSIVVSRGTTTRLLVRVIAGIVETVVPVRVGFGVTAANAGVAVKASATTLTQHGDASSTSSRSGRDPASRQCDRFANRRCDRLGSVRLRVYFLAFGLVSNHVVMGTLT